MLLPFKQAQLRNVNVLTVHQVTGSESRLLLAGDSYVYHPSTASTSCASRNLTGFIFFGGDVIGIQVSTIGSYTTIGT